MDSLQQLQVFVRVAELGSFTRAAEAMNLAKASVSDAVRRLEQRIGARLLHRTTRRVELTQDGRAYYERCTDLLAGVDELDSMFRTGGRLQGRVRVDLPSRIVRNFVMPHLRDFLRAHPALELELGSTDRRVDLVREGYDCVLRVGDVGDTRLVARPLGRFAIVNCASPVYLREYGMPQRLEDLGRHRLVHYAAAFGARPDGFEYFDGERWREWPMRGALTVNDSDAYQLACLHGLGLIQAPRPGLEPLLRSGELVEVLPQYQAAPMPVNLLYPDRRQLPRRVQVFMQWLAGVLQPALEPPPAPERGAVTASAPPPG